MADEKVIRPYDDSMPANLPEITIGSPVRDRAWILPMHLQKILELDYPLKKITLLFLLNDCTDKSEDVLKLFSEHHADKFNQIILLRKDLGTSQDTRETHEKRKPVYYALADLRNTILDRIETPYYLSVDTDILMPPETLKVLLASQKNIVAGVIWNDYIARPRAVYPNARPNFLIEKSVGGVRKLVSYTDYPLNTVFEVHTTGAVCLMSKAVCDSVRFEGSSLGEDIPFCINARKAGFRVWVNSSLFCHHIMIAYQGICSRCAKECKAVRVKDNVVSPELKDCPRKEPLETLKRNMSHK
jgi:hypothetical protein